ncbi:MAG: SpoIIE family protein phosphatase [Calditrichaceae bacterium]|nr:SpoIIE family protein phosphatase [Calditrichia bacterium]NUQ40962.1 SpoIIE family protein phosphatase [Calditrichaceae bacterium]
MFLLILLLTAWSCKTSFREYEVTFMALPDSLPAGSAIHLTGNQFKLGNWRPDGPALNPQPDGSWTKTLKFEKDAQLEYKFTRGSWRNEAFSDAGLEFPNFTLTVTRDTTVTVRIPHWRDTYRGKTVLSYERMVNKVGNLELFENWRYHPGDDPAWSAPDFEDREWETVNPLLPFDQYPASGWPGIGWFRTHLTIDSSLWAVPLAIFVDQAGASEVYLNGRMLYRFGEVSAAKEGEQPFFDRTPRAIVFDNQHDQVLAVRYSNHSAEYLKQIGYEAGFLIRLGHLNSYTQGRIEEVRNASLSQIIFSAVPLTLALVHLLMFIFYPAAKENLFYAVSMIGFAALSYVNFQFFFTNSVHSIILLNRILLLSTLTALVFGLLTTYTRGYSKLPRHGFIFVGVAAIIAVSSLFSHSKIVGTIFDIFLGIALVELIRVIFRCIFRMKKREWISGIGFLALTAAVVYQILIDANLVSAPGGRDVVYVYGVLVLSIAMSINLARDFARANQQLLESERQAREQEIQRRLLEADNARKTAELEEARRIQLSMLPEKVPQLPHLDIAVYMKTASEVGGDYYDFQLDSSGILTAAIGDATGHGTRAGIMVTLMKSLFNTMGNTFYIPDFFHHCTRMIRKMHLGNLYMAMLLVRIRGNKLVASSAGMPPILIFRKQNRAVEELLIKGMPLGGPEGYHYQQVGVELSPGDAVLLMSDGLEELFNDKWEIFDTSRIKTVFAEAGDRDPQEIIAHLNEAAERWRNGRPQNDDMTFVVLKMK